MGQGKEAVTVRRVMLVIVLVSASFLGGAFVNGPGLQWVQTKLLRSLGLNNEGEITSVDLKAVVSADTTSDGPMSVKPAADAIQGPLTTPPSLLTEDELSKYDAPNRPSTLQGHLKSASTGSILRRPELSSAKRSSTLVKSAKPEPPASDMSVRPVGAMASLAAATVSSGLATNSAPALLNSLATSLPANTASSNSPLSVLSPPAGMSAPKSTGSGNDNWAILERKMQSLGVSCYMVEGEPGGRIVFSCLIPVAGRQAVAQRFEAEGDDIIHAAQAAIRRIILWQATQPSSP
jgi:hypothetical protein